MTTELYLAAMGALVDVVLGAVTKGIQALKDISDSEGEQLHQLCQSVLARAEPLFVVRDAIAGGSGAAKVGKRHRAVYRAQARWTDLVRFCCPLSLWSAGRAPRNPLSPVAEAGGAGPAAAHQVRPGGGPGRRRGHRD